MTRLREEGTGSTYYDLEDYAVLRSLWRKTNQALVTSAVAGETTLCERLVLVLRDVEDILAFLEDYHGFGDDDV